MFGMPNGDSNGGGEGSRKGRRDERRARRNKVPEENKDKEENATWDKLRFSRALGKAIGDTTKRPAQRLPEYEHTKQQHVRFWLKACQNLFDGNP